jgi:hypothetical protein
MILFITNTNGEELGRFENVEHIPRIGETISCEIAPNPIVLQVGYSLKN